MIALIFYFSLAILVSFLCSILEAVMLSMTPSFVASLQERKRPVAKRMEELKRDPEKPLAAILTLNTIAHTVGAAGVGAQAQVVFQHIPLSVISGVLTLGILVLSEIIPKTLGATYWRALAVPSTYLTLILIWILYPFILLSRGISRLISPETVHSQVSRDEIAAMAELGYEGGVIDRTETDALRSLIRFGSQTIEDIYTPRTVTLFFQADSTIREVIHRHPKIAYSRIPVIGRSADDVLGYVAKHDILEAAVAGRLDFRVRDFVRKVIVVPMNALVAPLFQRFLCEHEHFAVVADEYGGVAGVVTLEDLIETMIGQEIMDESDAVADLRQWAAQRRREDTEDSE